VKKSVRLSQGRKAGNHQSLRPKITPAKQLTRNIITHRFGHGPAFGAAARSNAGRGFVQVNINRPVQRFRHARKWRQRMIEMKKQIGRADCAVGFVIWTNAVLLDGRWFCIMTEFGRTIASAPASGKGSGRVCGKEHRRKSRARQRKNVRLSRPFQQWQLHDVFLAAALERFRHGKTADEHPIAGWKIRSVSEDVHATIYKALGIPADTAYVTEGRPVLRTKDGKWAGGLTRF